MHGDAIGERKDCVHVVFDEQDRRFRAEPIEETGQRLGAFRSHSGHRLIEQECLRAKRKRDGDLELTPLTMRQFRRRGAGAVGKTHARQRGHRRLRQTCISHHVAKEAEAGPLPCLNSQHDIAQRREFRRQRRNLEGSRKPASGPLGDAQRADVLTEKADRPAAWFQCCRKSAGSASSCPRRWGRSGREFRRRGDRG